MAYSGDRTSLVGNLCFHARSRSHSEHARLDYSGLALILAAKRAAKMRKRTIHSRDYELLLKMLREARKPHVTQAIVAKRLGMTQSAVSKCELGERRLDVVQLRDWCKAIEVPFIEFMTQFDRKA